MPKIEDKKKFIEMWNAGISEKQIAIAFNVSQPAVSLAAKSLDLNKRSRGKFSSRPPPTDQEILAFIREKGVCSIRELHLNFGGWKRVFQRNRENRMRKLVREGTVQKFQLKKGGKGGAHRKRGLAAHELFNGLTAQIYYYTNEDKAARLIVEKLGLEQSSTRYERKRFTSYLKRCLPPSLFETVYKQYCSERGRERES